MKPETKRWWQRGGRLLAELVVVFDVLPIDLIRSVQLYFARLEHLGNLTRRTSTLSDEYLLPRVGADPEAFYDEAGRLEPEYRWYERDVRQMNAIITSITAYGDSLQSLLDAPPPPTP